MFMKTRLKKQIQIKKKSYNENFGDPTTFDKTVNDDTLEKEDREKGENKGTDLIKVREVDLMGPENISFEDTFYLTDKVRIYKSDDASCQFCQRKFRKLKDLEKHTSNKVCLKYFPCHVCGIKFSSGANLKRHVHEIKGSCSMNAGSEDLKYEAIYMDTEDISHQSENSLLNKMTKETSIVLFAIGNSLIISVCKITQ